MKRSIQAALFSGLILPGLGHMLLKRYLRGWLLAIGALLALGVLVTSVTNQALSLVERINGGEIPVNLTSIAQQASRYSEVSASGVDNLALIGLGICWVIGIVDAYRIGAVGER